MKALWSTKTICSTLKIPCIYVRNSKNYLGISIQSEKAVRCTQDLLQRRFFVITQFICIMSIDEAYLAEEARGTPGRCVSAHAGI